MFCWFFGWASFVLLMKFVIQAYEIILVKSAADFSGFNFGDDDDDLESLMAVKRAVPKMSRAEM